MACPSKTTNIWFPTFPAGVNQAKSHHINQNSAFSMTCTSKDNNDSSLLTTHLVNSQVTIAIKSLPSEGLPLLRHEWQLPNNCYSFNQVTVDTKDGFPTPHNPSKAINDHSMVPTCLTKVNIEGFPMITHPYTTINATKDHFMMTDDSNPI